jgi:hypothetical protein
LPVEGEIPVAIIHNDGVADAGAMLTNLMHAAGLEGHSEKCTSGISLHYGKVCDGRDRFAIPTGKRKVDGAGILAKASHDEAKIFLSDIPLSKSSFQFLGCALAFCNDEDAGCVFVEPVNQFRRGTGPLIPGLENAQQGAVLWNPFPLVHGESWRLVDEQ